MATKIPLMEDLIQMNSTQFIRDKRIVTQENNRTRTNHLIKQPTILV